MNEKSIENSETKPKVVVLWTAPRCVSTAFEKAFSQRSDTAIFHEPFLDVYYYSRWRRSERFGDDEKCLYYRTNQVIKNIKSQTEPVVFIKEMAYQALPYIDRNFVKQPLVNTFLVRHPKKSLLSWYKLNEFPTEEEFGFDALEKMWKIVMEESKQRPIVVEADSLQKEPEKTLLTYCQAVGIELATEMLSWEKDRVKQDSSHKANVFSKWHQTLENSQGILPPTEAVGEIRARDMPMFERAMKTYCTLHQCRDAISARLYKYEMHPNHEPTTSYRADQNG